MHSWQILETTMRFDRQIRLARANEAHRPTAPEDRGTSRVREYLQAFRATVAGAGVGATTSPCDECCPVGAATTG